MEGLVTARIQCPSCGETIELVVDCSVVSQRYVEDCSVCCRPMNVNITVDADGVPHVEARGCDD